ncbi:MAG TPA: 50S ribosomal protein L25/general stress protein Ctc [Flavobacteriales bacterium]|nr:50S ribosomal protein L25/general stress protein Ctc [Flavobacteriales bacterium]
MKTLAISAKLRNGTGKTDSKALRNQGNVPCVLYGGEKQVCFYAHENDFRNLVYTPDVFIVELDIEGEKYQAVMQDLQFHPATDKLLHLDFLQIFDDKEVTMTIPVHLEGMSIGIRNGGVLSFRRRKIITRAIPGNLPDYIEINIEDLDIGQSIFIKDLRVDKYSFLALDNAVVVGVRTARELIIEEEEEEELEGEIIEGEEGAAAEETKATEKAEGEAGSEEKPAAE